MLHRSWTDEENDLIVTDYFEMLEKDMAGHPYNKGSTSTQITNSTAKQNKGSQLNSNIKI